MAERRTDPDTRDRIDQIERELSERLDKFDEKFTARADANAEAGHRALTWVIGAIIAFGIGMSGALGLTVVLNGKRVDDVQASRRESATLSCLETGERHDRALIQFDKLLLRAVDVKPKTYPARLSPEVLLDRYDRDLQEAFKLERVRKLPRFQQIRTSATTTPLLIDALVPKRDCVAYVRRLIK